MRVAVATGLHRFFVDPALLEDEPRAPGDEEDRPALASGRQIALTGPQAHQMSRVLRLKVGDRAVLLDGAGREYVVRLDEVRSSTVTVTVEIVQRSRPEPGLILTLYQALVPRDRFETVLQKGTEIGVSRFVPVWCERSIVPGGDKIDGGRLERWRRIVTEAAEQCERGIVPEVVPPLRFSDALAAAVNDGPLMVAWEREHERSLSTGLRAVLDGARSLGLMIGPEGGFSKLEIEQAREAGAVTVSLGPRILRTETAGPILAALALYQAGDLTPTAS
jgi:16S rRNA (uracil1498-N3)-methyltransferase